jgi:Protein of unknown function (DUF938)
VHQSDPHRAVVGNEVPLLWRQIIVERQRSPVSLQGRHTSPSNRSFDFLLRRQNPAWGVRDLDDVSRLADGAGFDLLQSHEMPSNNLIVVFGKRA